ncbi:hypothetical protein [Streptomyces rimosus]|uniref:hypothetical protein n=1 Tax=Streptomyces rimosus TaxID=1927 RepID=UPI001C3F4288|nr:hypothetical protein [Streptomyces rimosus]
MDGEDIGRWLKAQREGWEQLHTGNANAWPLSASGPVPDEDQDVVEDGPVGTEAFPNGVPGLAGMNTFERGVAALTQYQAARTPSPCPANTPKPCGRQKPTGTVRTVARKCWCDSAYGYPTLDPGAPNYGPNSTRCWPTSDWNGQQRE